MLLKTPFTAMPALVSTRRVKCHPPDVLSRVFAGPYLGSEAHARGFLGVLLAERHAQREHSTCRKGV